MWEQRNVRAAARDERKLPSHLCRIKEVGGTPDERRTQERTEKGWGEVNGKEAQCRGEWKRHREDKNWSNGKEYGGYSSVRDVKKYWEGKRKEDESGEGSRAKEKKAE